MQRRRIESQIFINVSCRHTHVRTHVHAYSAIIIEIKSNFNLVDFTIILLNLYTDMCIHVHLLLIHICTVSTETPLYVKHIDLSLHRLLLWGKGVAKPIL